MPVLMFTCFNAKHTQLCRAVHQWIPDTYRIFKYVLSLYFPYVCNICYDVHTINTVHIHIYFQDMILEEPNICLIIFIKSHNYNYILWELARVYFESLVYYNITTLLSDHRLIDLVRIVSILIFSTIMYWTHIILFW